MGIRNTTSVHDHPRQEVLTAMRKALDFLEATPEIDIPESMGELWVRTLARQNRGELKTKEAVTEWFQRQLNVLQPSTEDLFSDGDHFGVVKDFGAGVRLSIHVGVNEVCDKTVNVKTVHRTEEASETTWHTPTALLRFGFNANQEYLREREREMSRFIRGVA